MRFLQRVIELLLSPMTPRLPGHIAAVALPEPHGPQIVTHAEPAGRLSAKPPTTSMDVPQETRVTVVGRDGRVFEDYDLFDNGCTVVVQDDGRTVKVLRR